MLKSLGGIEAIILFIIPGFIIDRVIALSIPRIERKNTELLLSAITLSCFNYAIFSWLVILTLSNDFVSKHLMWFVISWLTILLVGPVFEGLGITWIINKGGLRWIYDVLGFRMVNPIPKAWDYQFGKREPYWVIITLNDDSIIGGLYGTGSFASSFPAEEDIFIEKLWKVDEYGRFQEPIEESGGALIKGRDIKLIEFFEITEQKEESQNG